MQILLQHVLLDQVLKLDIVEKLVTVAVRQLLVDEGFRAE
jgi:hypothetical protein